MEEAPAEALLLQPPGPVRASQGGQGKGPRALPSLGLGERKEKLLPFTD